MKWLNGLETKLMLFGFVAAIVLGSGERGKAEIIMSEPTSVGPVINDATDVQESDFSHDGLELYFSSQRPGGYGRNDIWVAKRETLNSPWQEPINLGPAVNSSAAEVEPAISPDGLELYLRWWDDWNLRVCTRPSKDEPWSSPVKVGPPVGSYEDNPPVGSNDVWSPNISADGLSLYFSGDPWLTALPQDQRPGGYGMADIWITTKQTSERNPEGYWSEPQNLGPIVNSSSFDTLPCISADSLLLFFLSNRPGGYGDNDLWMTRRRSRDEEWETPINLGPTVNSMSDDITPEISPDGSTLLFSSDRPGGFGSYDIYQVPIIPVVDLNDDGIVDSADMCIVVDHWGTDEPLCDIGPMPWGDGIVDVQDLIVLTEHLFEEVDDPTLVAHWALDEIEGDIAYDSAGTCVGTLLDDPVWQPAGGMVDGALQFDGVDDCIVTGSIPNPIKGPFSVFAWVKGGAPGQAVLSQMGGVRWLCADPSDGNLMTELKATGRGANELLSQTIITGWLAQNALR